MSLLIESLWRKSIQAAAMPTKVTAELCEFCAQGEAIVYMFPLKRNGHYRCRECKTHFVRPIPPEFKPRRILYLDQYVISSLAKESSTAWSHCLGLLTALTEAQLWICPWTAIQLRELSWDRAADRRAAYSDTLFRLSAGRQLLNPEDQEALFLAKALGAFVRDEPVPALSTESGFFVMSPGAFMMPLRVSLAMDPGLINAEADERARNFARNGYPQVCERWQSQKRTRKEWHDEEMGVQRQLYRAAFRQLTGIAWSEPEEPVSAEALKAFLTVRRSGVLQLIDVARESGSSIQTLDSFLRSNHFSSFPPFQIQCWLYGAIAERCFPAGRSSDKGRGDLTDVEHVSYSLPYVTDLFVDKQFDELLKIPELAGHRAGRRIWTQRNLDEFIHEAETALQSDDYGAHKKLFENMDQGYWDLMRSVPQEIWSAMCNGSFKVEI